MQNLKKESSMKFDTVKDILIAVGAAGALFMSTSKFVQNVNEVPKHDRQIKKLNRRVNSVENMGRFLVSDVERRTGKRYVEPIMRDDEE